MRLITYFSNLKQLQRQLYEFIQQTLFVSIPHQQNLVAHAPLLIV